ncbi:unnamed protein product [Peronospora belbahrii]|uniref:Kinesin motor domain-containing protein n=1 Tax=Peronospora belbahrii TaxID=622444 RepID=A0AAU9KQR1_9STRA|nr:unnamed protein product [Peronospora belbahrii]
MSSPLSSSSPSTNHDTPPPLPTPTNVQVAVRCRPLNHREKSTGRGAVVQCKPNSNEVAVLKRKTYTFDRVFGQYSTQKDVFDTVVRPAVDEALAGYNCTVFAYGQTGTGKTYTMQGDLSRGSETAGIIPRSVQCIFDTLKASDEEFSVRVSFLQLYNEELKDLLDPDTDKKLRLMEDTKRGGIYCVNLLEITATTAKHVYDLVNTGVKNRITSETLMNENSSRSHSIFTVRIHSKEHNAAGEDLLRVGQLNLVDLAGSECVGRSGARNARAREAGTINQSLLTLGRVITALVDNLPHVPYRDSKLTRLLQESLGGRAKTTIIATLAPCADSLDETLSTLEYAFRAKNIKNKPELNQKMTKAGLLNDFGSEIEMLRAALRAARMKDGVYLPLEQFTDMQERLAGQTVQLTELEDILKARNISCKELEEVAEKHASEVASLTLAKQEVSDKLTRTEDELTLTKQTLEKTTHELQQVQNVLKAYQENEQVLLANGATAEKLYDACENRAAQLLVKIENTQRTEETNTELASLYRSDVQCQIGAFLKKLTEHNGESRHLNAMQSLVEAHRLQITESLAADDAQRTRQREEVVISMKRQQEAMQNQLDKLVEVSKCHATVIMEDLSTSKWQNVAFLENVQSTLECSRKELASFLTEQSDKLLELQAAIDMSVVKQGKELDESKAALVAALKDSRARQEEELNGVKAHLAQYIETCIQSQSRKLDEQTLLIEENTKKQHKHLSHVQTITEQQMKGFVQAMGSQNAKQESETAGCCERLSEMRGQLGETNARQTELIKSHERQQMTWRNDTTELANTHSEKELSLSEKHSQDDAATLIKRREQLMQFFDEHKELRQLVNGGYKTLGEGLQCHISHTKGKIDSVASLGNDIVVKATAASTQQLDEMETYMKKRKINTRTGTTPVKTDDRPFPSFASTKISAEQLVITQHSSSYANSLGDDEPSHKRRRMSHPGRPDNVTTTFSAMQSHSNAPVSIDAVTDVTASSSSQDSQQYDPVSATEANSIGISLAGRQTSIKPVTPSKMKKTGSSGLHKKKFLVVHTNKSMKIPNARAETRKTPKTSSHAVSKR